MNSSMMPIPTGDTIMISTESSTTMKMMQTVKLTPEQITAIERTLTAGDRVELVPVNDGAKVFQLRRKEINGGNNERQ